MADFVSPTTEKSMPCRPYQSSLFSSAEPIAGSKLTPSLPITKGAVLGRPGNFSMISAMSSQTSWFDDRC